MSPRNTLVCLALCGLAWGCAVTGAAPVDFRGSGPQAERGQGSDRGPAPIELRAPLEDVAPALSMSSSPPDWAAGPGVPLSAFALQPEEAQPFDPRNPASAHVVQSGETLYTIAAHRQTPLRALIDANRLSPPFAIEVGQVLTLPPPLFHTVRPGETLASIARRYNVDLRSLALLNRMQAPYAIYPGDRLAAPAGARAIAAPFPPAPRALSAPAPAGGDAAGLVLPVAGEVLVGFGPHGVGARSDGIEIAAQPGAPVLAAADGVVLYVGSDLENHGVVVILAHVGELTTTYAFTRNARVQNGQRVRQREPIAEAGGAPDAPSRLLFQVRQGGAPLDPSALTRP